MSSRSRPKFIIPEVIEDKSHRKEGHSYTKRYKRGKYLGKGGFAQCYEMTSYDSGRTYAGKIIPKASLTKSSARRKLLNEIKIHRSISHQNVVKFEYFFEDKDNVYILLEICTNQTLMELQKRRKVLTEPECKCLMWQIINTMAALHKDCIIHRDLKLGNLFLDKDFEIKVGDFGLATKLQHPEERKRTICGTPNYIAPEILDNRNGHSFEVDVWSIGVIMYTMLIGRPPFETASVKSTYKRIQQNEYSFPAHTHISSSAKSLITSILHNKPEMRPTLNDIREHAFFKKYTFPLSLPQSCMTTPLDFTPQLANSSPRSDIYSTSGQENTKRAPLGDRTNSVTARRSGLSKQSPASRMPSAPLSSSIRPMTARNVNTMAPPASKGPVDTHTKPWTEPEYTKNESSKKSKINWDAYDAKKEEGLQSVKFDEEDKDNFKHMHDEIEQSFCIGKRRKVETKSILGQPVSSYAVSSSSSSAASVNNGKPLLSVQKWLDFSKKYGLGYIFSNGNTGVYFNDSSKIILHSDEKNFEYIERRSSSGKGGGKSAYTLTDYPSTLEKKVTLLKHFQQYLKGKVQQQEKKDGIVTVNPKLHAGDEDGDGMVYVKKWLRTRHAILFRMSNRTVQVIFFDNTQIVLSSKSRQVSYQDKTGAEKTYPLDSVFEVPRPDLAKRMKYIKDILYYLFSRKTPLNSSPV